MSRRAASSTSDGAREAAKDISASRARVASSRSWAARIVAYCPARREPKSNGSSAPSATVALGADDPLLFGSQLAAQYATMRAAHDLDDATLAELARMSVRASRAPSDVRQRVLAEIDAWLAGPEEPAGPVGAR